MLKEGPNNTKFFHKVINAHKRRDFLAKIKVNEEWLLEEINIKQGMAWAFQQLLSDTRDWRPNINHIYFKTLDQ